MSKIETNRRSAKQVIAEYISQLQARGDHESNVKLIALETVALRMNWQGLYRQIRFKKDVVRSTAQAELAGGGSVETDHEYWSRFK